MTPSRDTWAPTIIFRMGHSPCCMETRSVRGLAISLMAACASLSAAGVHPAPSPGSRTGRTAFDSHQEILSQRLTLLLSVSAWPSRSIEQIAYGKGAFPRTVKEEHVPYHVRNEVFCRNLPGQPPWCERMGHHRESFLVFFCPSHPLRTHELEL